MLVERLPPAFKRTLWGQPSEWLLLQKTRRQQTVSKRPRIGTWIGKRERQQQRYRGAFLVTPSASSIFLMKSTEGGGDGGGKWQGDNQLGKKRNIHLRNPLLPRLLPQRCCDIGARPGIPTIGPRRPIADRSFRHVHTIPSAFAQMPTRILYLGETFRFADTFVYLFSLFVFLILTHSLGYTIF